jgi:7-carboxy-7-deazaguanine synthase
MSYSVKEIFYTLQGEGANTGRAAVFLRFAGCNLWSGREEDRGRGPSCSRWCDTNFVGTDGPGGGKFTHSNELATAVAGLWPTTGVRPFVVCTGGEPLLQLDIALLTALHASGFEVAIETNGTLKPPTGIDWVCVSPKAATDLVVQQGDELKLIFPQPDAEPEQFVGLDFRHSFLQPLDGRDKEHNTRLAVDYCLAHPRWRLSLQTHKYLGIP